MITLLRRLALVAACLAAVPGHPRPAAAQTRIYAEFLGGSSYNLPVPLRVEQTGQPALRITARYDTRGLSRPVYYAVRLALGGEALRWEVELIHQKLHLRNRPPEVQRFEITHGYNLLLLNRVRFLSGWGLRAGAGVVLPHPESVVRGRVLEEDGGLLGWGYHLTGPALQVAATGRLPGRGRLRLRAEAKLTAAYARVPVAGGRAVAPNVALHGLIGLGYRVR